MQGGWLEALIIVTTSIGAALLALMLLSYLAPRRPPARPSAAAHPVLEPTVFLFDDRHLVDATGPARSLLAATQTSGNDWDRLCAFLAPRFEGFVRAMGSLAEQGRLELTSAPEADPRPPLHLLAEHIGGLARITLVDPAAEGRGVLVDGLSQRALEDELALLRQAFDSLPAPVWREDGQGAVCWANRAYLLLSDAFGDGEDCLVWPLPRLFPHEAAPPTTPRRLRLARAAGPLWFDCHSFVLTDGALHYAQPADATIRAETALRDFVQTLTKTFAGLPIGLAIFDRERRLQLFNPALIDLTQLSPDFLSARPTLYALLDRLRESRMMPEPKDYRSWRLQMTALEKAAAAGFHTETWNLPGGQTYRVTGRPHPDGAVAFLVEDISAEVSLTRRFRAELELSQEVLDLMPEAVAVFRTSGELALSNRAYDALWQVEPGTTLGRVTILDATRRWQEICGASMLWPQARAFCLRSAERLTIEGEVPLPDGTPLRCRFVPIQGGAMLAGFTPAAVPLGALPQSSG